MDPGVIVSILSLALEVVGIVQVIEFHTDDIVFNGFGKVSAVIAPIKSGVAVAVGRKFIDVA